MHDHLLCLKAFEGAPGSEKARVLNMTWLYMQGLRRVPNMFDHDSICLDNA